MSAVGISVVMSLLIGQDLTDDNASSTVDGDSRFTASRITKTLYVCCASSEEECLNGQAYAEMEKTLIKEEGPSLLLSGEGLSFAMTGIIARLSVRASYPLITLFQQSRDGHFDLIPGLS